MPNNALEIPSSVMRESSSRYPTTEDTCLRPADHRVQRDPTNGGGRRGRQNTTEAQNAPRREVYDSPACLSRLPGRAVELL